MLLAVVVALCALVVLVVFMVMPGESNAVQRAPFWGVNHAHRGLHTPDTSIPENSLAAFTAAVDGGYGIELDLQLTRDEEVVVFHDDDLARVCGVEGKLCDFTFDELRALRLHGTSQQIPHLLEVLQVVDGRVPLIIELKSMGPKNRLLCQRTWRILRQYDGDICVESFDPRIVRWFKKNVPGLLRGQLSATPQSLGNGVLGWFVGNGLANFWGRPNFVAYEKGRRPLLVRFAHRFSMSVVWTVRPEDDIDAIEDAYDAVIFEFYEPLARYADAPGEPDTNLGEEEYRF